MGRDSLNGEWIHNNTGNSYNVIATSNTKASVGKKVDYPVTVIYQDAAGEIWTRILNNFTDNFTQK